jgi:hypothetical protein
VDVSAENALGDAGEGTYAMPGREMRSVVKGLVDDDGADTEREDREADEHAELVALKADGLGKRLRCRLELGYGCVRCVSTRA